MASMATITFRRTAAGEEKWKVQFRMGGRGSKNTSKTFNSERGAEVFKRLVGELGPVRALEVLAARTGSAEGVPTVERWCTAHIDDLSGVQQDTIKKYRSYVSNDLGNLGHLPVDAVTHEDVSRWVNAMAKKTWRGKPTSGKTIKNKHGFLSAVFAHAEMKGLVQSNPCKGTRLPRTVTEPMVFLTHDEYTRILGCFTPHWRPLVEFLFSTGLRWGEATALRVGEVDLEHGTATVVRAWKRGGILGAPKSSKSRRTVALSPETVSVLTPLVDKRSGDAYVFRNMLGGPVRHQTFHESVWQPAVRLANGEDAVRGGAKRTPRRLDAKGQALQPLDPPLGKRPRIHDARHTNASWLLGAGVPINYVQAHLGHESITTTVDRYGHVMPAAQLAIRSAISVALAQAHPQIEDEEVTQTGDTPARIEAAS
jgi:integrase